ncbi:MAG: hypothetical protein ACTHNU_01250, partial [Gaiellales bacterium]
PVILVVLILLCLISIVIVPGAVLLAIPIAVILGIVLAVGLVRGAAASRGGSRVESSNAGAGVRDALSTPGDEDPDRTSARTHTQG